MRIGIDCRTILNPKAGEKAGVGHYTYFLINNLLEIDQKNEYVLFFDDRISKESIDKLISGRGNIKIRFFPFYKYKKVLPIIYSHFIVAKFIKKEHLDLFHSPANTLPLTYSGKSVITVHDLAIYKHPEWFPSGLFINKFSKKITVPKSIKKADKIIAVSKSTKQDIIDIFKVPEEKIEVVYEGVLMESCNKESSRIGQVRIKDKYNLSDKYILFLGTIEPRKNIKGLIKAFLKLDDKNLQLAIAGTKGWKYEDIFKEIENNKKKIRYLGYVQSEDKEALIKNAIVFIFPSFYEGFGLPVLEAMSFGTPIIISNRSSLPEVAGDAGILVNPENIDEIRDVIERVVGNEKLRSGLRIKSLEQAKNFTWQRCARETLSIYRAVYER